jgi:Family of unknown function (DUF6489)
LLLAQAGIGTMKFNIEVDATPEEVRRLIGLPDLTEVHEVYLGQLKKLAAKGVTADSVQQMVRSWMPLGDAGLDIMKAVMGGLGTKPSK